MDTLLICGLGISIVLIGVAGLMCGEEVDGLRKRIDALEADE